MIKTGIIGGTFDPIHIGHIAIADAAFEEYGLDQVWFMPAGDPYFKEGSGVTPPMLRMEMTKACVSALSDRYDCIDIEVMDKKKTYSALTFEKLNIMYPDNEFYFIMGLDSLRSLYKWYMPGLLLESAIILCAARQKDDGSGNMESAVKEIEEAAAVLREVYYDSAPDIRVIHTPLINLSSTMIREMIRAGEDISAYVTPETADFIRSHKLYL